MTPIRSLLWIGSAETLVRDRVTDAPELDVTWVRNADEAIALPPLHFDAALLDDPDANALLPSLRRLKHLPSFPPILVRLQKFEARRLRTLLAAGATDVMLAPAGDGGESLLEELCQRVDRLARAQIPASEPGRVKADSGRHPGGVIGVSRAMQRVFALVERAANSAATVLLSGATGTGKEVVACAIHEQGTRRNHNFVAINCAAFPDSLLESELFGYVKGAFTGADRDKPGLFAAADGGTLFLDEIGETSGPLQAKLLRVLQDRHVRPVGGTQSRHVDVRVIAATNRDLRSEAGRGFFRNDLYYRLAVFPIALPPLRKRRDDILPLAQHFLERFGASEGVTRCRLSRASEHLLLSYDWPGNVRELENEMHRVLALSEPGELITPALLSDRLAAVAEPIDRMTCDGESLRDSIARIEALLIRRRLEHNGGRRAATARQLGITREGLYKKMQRLGIK